MQEIITGYTGTRHITPAMDAAVWRSIFGEDHYIVNVGNKCAGSMPNINEFVIMDGVVSMQGHMGYGTQESLSIDTCATGYKRIDLICCRFTHDNNSLIDKMEYIVIKGAEVQAPNVPVVPAYNTGIIDQGATVVDFPMYQINLDGSTVTFTKKAAVIELGGGMIVIDVAAFSALPFTITNESIKSTMYAVKAELSNPSAQTGDWTVTTADGSAVVSGNINGTTTMKLYLNPGKAV